MTSLPSIQVSHMRKYADAERDFWMTSAEALEYGMIDEFLKKKKD